MLHLTKIETYRAFRFNKLKEARKEYSEIANLQNNVVRQYDCFKKKNYTVNL